MLDRTVHPAPRGDLVWLRDGTSCRIRPIGADDGMFLADCFAGLSPESRRLRFFGAKPVLTARDIVFLTSADGRDHIALGAVRLNDAGEETEALGVVRCIRAEPGVESAEFAIAVVDAAQGCGVGRALVTRLVEAARRQGITEFHYEVLAENKRMRALARGMTSQVQVLDGNTLEYRYRLPVADQVADQVAEPDVTDLLDPVVAARQWLAVWSGGVGQLLDTSLVLCQLLVGFWLGSGVGTADESDGAELPLALAD